MVEIMRGKELHITIVGAGTAIPSPKHSAACVLLQWSNFIALLDIGPGAISKLPYYGIDPFLLEHIFITHLHPDHTLDLGTFFMILDYGKDKRHGLPLNLIGCVGLEKFIYQFMGAFPDINLPVTEMQIREVTNNEFFLGNIRVRSALSGHTGTSVSFRFDFKDISVVYTGDCVQNTELEMMCDKADILITECSFPDKWKTNDHMNAQTLGKMAERANVKKLVVTHQYPSALEVDIESQLKEYYSGSILIAEDGSRVKID